MFLCRLVQISPLLASANQLLAFGITLPPPGIASLRATISLAASALTVFLAPVGRRQFVWTYSNMFESTKTPRSLYHRSGIHLSIQLLCNQLIPDKSGLTPNVWNHPNTPDTFTILQFYNFKASLNHRAIAWSCLPTNFWENEQDCHTRFPYRDHGWRRILEWWRRRWACLRPSAWGRFNEILSAEIM
jgi:hypothetical protein